jgi:hypothetical protein
VADHTFAHGRAAALWQRDGYVPIMCATCVDQDLAAGDIAGNPSGDLVDEIKRDPMIPSHDTTFGAFGIGDDAVAPSEAIGP